MFPLTKVISWITEKQCNDTPEKALTPSMLKFPTIFFYQLACEKNNESCSQKKTEAPNQYFMKASHSREKNDSSAKNKYQWRINFRNIHIKSFAIKNSARSVQDSPIILIEGKAPQLVAPGRHQQKNGSDNKGAERQRIIFFFHFFIAGACPYPRLFSDHVGNFE
ncbi:MAG: hypothetical protein CVV41_12385 [Candidatus Riflebacteria bacterium HGW-Riflebacteria-1]|nr:MAG: hypothetical protein CVV41_12385 [Candidatus Riflebacteria bacterium HGW-Riflebacteria-1]